MSLDSWGYKEQGPGTSHGDCRTKGRSCLGEQGIPLGSHSAPWPPSRPGVRSSACIVIVHVLVCAGLSVLVTCTSHASATRHLILSAMLGCRILQGGVRYSLPPQTGRPWLSGPPEKSQSSCLAVHTLQNTGTSRSCLVIQSRSLRLVS